MTQENISIIMTQLSGQVAPEHLVVIKNKLANSPDERVNEILALEAKSPITVLLLSIFLGSLGVDRFILGQIGSGIAKLLVGWLTFGIWHLVDICTAISRTKKYNYSKIALMI